MKFDFKTFGKVSLAVARVAVPQIEAVEKGIKAVGEAKSGTEKRKAVVGTVRSSVELAEAMAGQEIMDEDLFEQGLNKINDGYVDIMNSLRQPPAEEGPSGASN